MYSTQIIDPLRKLLYDANYHVRINSALSLAKMGEEGVDALVEETRSDDRFVRDVTQFALKRLIYAS
jgi:HEAT repeat protein